MSIDTGIRCTQSRAKNSRQAAREFHAGVTQDDTALVIFFCSSTYDLAELAHELNRLFAGIPLIGCTTAGEIGPAGYLDHSISGVSLSSAMCTAVTGRLADLQRFESVSAQRTVKDFLYALEQKNGGRRSENAFAFLLIDGLSVREEPVVRGVQEALGDVPLCGGSAGDDFRFRETFVYHEGAFRTDCAVLAVVESRLPFRLFKTQHFVRDAERMVVTEADASRRIVTEINGRPAAVEYARVLGVDPATLGPEHFAKTPVVVVIDGCDYVRSIQKSDEKGALTFYCAIEEGLVLRVAHGIDLVDNLARTFDRLRSEIGPISLTFGCDCILRSLEMQRSDQREAVSRILKDNNVVGFATYGEQIGGVHVNQTFTGIAIGSSDLSARHD